MDSWVTSRVKKISENNSDKTNSDIHGRIEYIDQSLRSADHRICAIEKRLSIKPFEHGTCGPEKIPVSESASCVTQDDLHELEDRLSHIEILIEETHAKEVTNLKEQFSYMEEKISRLENLNRITIGKIKVPVEFSGLAATLVMFITGYLIYTNHWNIIRSSYYPIGVGILFGAVVAGKFILTNREHIK